MPVIELNRSSAWPRGVGGWINLLGGVILLSFAWLAITSWREASVPLSIVFISLGIAWTAVLVAWRLSRRLAERSLIRWIWIWAVLFRVSGFFGERLLEDDYWRYLWDGRTIALTGNPYAGKPIDSFHDPAVPERRDGDFGVAFRLGG